ncbi:glycosyltransferase family 2 protein [Kaistella yonginensis]|uniref:glycosyltransferase family 2 protein n=1 Tax=Kaistella yonginensis TaxID=658267 RepID=UPI0025B57989|nr:glycosyltransferase family 2 protein [Kaistella yonginensis]MDN3605688.1 glycosyltransferase [Kaistella yonginensis]
MKKISIIIPCYNVEYYIFQCLESVINQTYLNLEIICINDGSTDSTLVLLQKIAKTDSRIIVVNQVNKGLSATRNVGIAKSTGEYLMFLDSDDYLDLNTITSLEKFFITNDLTCFSYNRIYQNTSKIRKFNIKGEFSAENIQRKMIGLMAQELSDPSQIDSLVTACMKIYHSPIIKENAIQFTDTSLIGTEDLLFNIQYLEIAKTVRIVDEPYYFYRKNNASSLTSLYKPTLFENWKNLYKIIEKIIENKPAEFKLALQNRICLSVIGVGLNETFSPKSYSDKKKRLNEILSDSLYTNSFSNLEMKYFPFHWKMFFIFAKRKQVGFLLPMLLVIKTKISK